MPRKALFDPDEAARKIRRLDQAQAERAATERAIMGAVTAHTQKQYEGRFRRMETFREALGREKWTAGLFALLIDALRESGVGDGEGYRAALIHFLEAQSRRAEVVEIRDKACAKMAQGLSLQAAKSRNPRGSVTPHMFEQLTRWMQRQYPAFVAPCRVAFEAQLRWSELARIRVGDVEKDAEGSEQLFVRTDKRVKRTNIHTPGTTKPISDELGKYMRTLMEGKEHGIVLFPRQSAPVESVRRAIREASVALKWPQDVDFSGPHCLRHGGTMELKGRVAEFMETQFANQSKRMVRHYGRSNENRKRPRE